jgi:AbrB family looped-hinge helix DNA binding protein
MVTFMEEEATVEGQGRLVIPAKVRRTLGLSKGGRVSVRLDGSRVLIEPRATSVVERVSEWKSQVSRARNRATFDETAGESKWMGEEYVRRKLGLR